MKQASVTEQIYRLEKTENIRSFWVEISNRPIPSFYGVLQKHFDIINRAGKQSDLEAKLNEIFGKFTKDKYNRPCLWISQDSEGKDSIFLICQNGLWHHDIKGDPKRIIDILIGIAAQLSEKIKVEEETKFICRQKSREHLRASHGYCTGEKCNCPIGRDIE